MLGFLSTTSGHDMRITSFLSSLAVAGLIGFTSMAPASAATTDVLAAANSRGMWTWYDTDVATATKQKNMLDFAVARKVNIIYLQSETLLNKPALLASFLDRAAARGVKVELLFGAAEWVLPANNAYVVNLVKRVNAFVATLKGARPVGMHFDIEPHGLAAWTTDPVTLGNQLVDLYGKLMAAKAPGLTINADIAMGYEYVSLTRGGVTKTMSQWMVDATDSTTLMDYRDYGLGEDSIGTHGMHPVSYALSRGKHVTLGVETTCNQELEKITFCEEGRTRMENELSMVRSYFQGNAGFGGFAVHDYVNYRKLAN